MILKENLSQAVDIIGDDIGDTEYGINAGDMGMAVKLYYQYSDAISSIVRECTSNAVDSHKEASMISSWTDDELKKLGYTGNLTSVRSYFNNWKDKPVIVRIINNSLLSDNTRKLEITDFGVGLSPNRMKRIFTKFFASTKRWTDLFIGAYGLGSKSPLGYCDMFLITTVYMGVKYEYAVHVGKEAPHLKVLSQEPTSEPNGSVFTIPIKSERDLASFRRAVCTQLMYFDNLIIEGVPEYSKKPIMRGEHFVYREGSSHRLHLCLGKVYYPLDTEHFSFPYNLALLPAGLRFNVGELDVVWNREAIEYTTETVDAINKKVLLLQKELQEIWDKSYSSIDTIERLAEAANSVQNRSLDIDGLSIHHTGAWITRNVVYTKRPQLGRFRDARFLSLAVSVDRVVSEGKTRQVSRYATMDAIKDTAYSWCMEKGDKSDPFVNEYLYMEKDIKSFYLVSWRDPEQAAQEMYAYSIEGGTNTAKVRWDLLNDAERNEVIEFAKEVFLYLHSKFKKYGRYLVPDEWIEERIISKKAKAKANKTAILNGDKIVNKIPVTVEMPYKRLDLYRQGYRRDEEWAWRMDTLFFNNLQASQLGNWIKHGLPIIYGTKEEKEKLQSLYTFLVGGASFNHKYKIKQMFNGAPMFIIVARNNRQYLSSLPNAFNIAEYQCKLGNLLRKVKTAELISAAVVKLVSTSTAIAILPEYSTRFHDLHRYVTRYKPHAKGAFYASRIEQTSLDTDIIKKLWQAVAIIRRFPMLEYVNDLNNHPENVRREFDKYFQDKGKVSPYVYMRLAEFKKRKAKACDPHV